MGLSIQKKFINVSVIGAGYMAEEHIKALKKFKQFKILGIMSKKNINAKKLAKKYKIKNVHISINDLFLQTSSNLLIVAVSETNVKNVIFQALKYPWKIFCEKPLGLNFNESKKIFQKANKLKRINDITVGFNRRSYDVTKFVLSDIDKSKKRLIQIFDQQNIYDKTVKKLPNAIKKNWMYANSIHLIDYSNIFCRGNIISSTKNIFNLERKSKVVIFTANYTSGDKLIYNALWSIPGPWSVIVSNQKKSYKFEPLESLKIKDFKSRKYFNVKINTQDEKYRIKIGLFYQTKELLNFAQNRQHKLCNLAESHKTMLLTKKIYT